MIRPLSLRIKPFTHALISDALENTCNTHGLKLFFIFLIAKKVSVKKGKQINILRKFRKRYYWYGYLY